MEFEFGHSSKAEAFFEEHPGFWVPFEGLLSISNKCFGRKCHYQNQAEKVMFSLGQTCREDYLEIVFMAAHGFNVATTKLIRGLYERAVTHAHIVKSPERVMSFIRFGAIQEYRLMNNAIEAGVEKKDFDARMPLENTIDKITERRNQVKDEFKVIECEQCGLEAPLSWDKLSIGAMARKLDDARYKALYLGSYAMPNLHIHATYMSAVYLENLGPQDKATAQKLEAYANVGNASAIMLLVLNEQNKMFNLGLDRELETAEKAIVEEWFSRKKPEQNDGDR